MRPAAGCSGRGSPRAPPPRGPALPPRPIRVRARGRGGGSPAPPPQRSMPTNKRPSPPRASFFEPDANLTLTSIIRSALSKLVVSYPLFPTPATQHHSSHPHPRYPPGSTGKARRSRTGPAKLTDRLAQARARTHARTRPRTQPHPTLQPTPSTALHTRPRAGRPT